MLARNSENPSFLIGCLLSFIFHLLGAIAVIVLLESSAATAARAPQIFTVTLEGGEVLGGITQVPEKGADPSKEAPKVAPPKSAEPTRKETDPTEDIATKTAEKKLSSPSVVEQQKKEAEKKALDEKKKKLAQEKLKKEAEEKRKRDAEAKQLEQKQREDEAKRKKEQERLKAAEEQKKAKAARDAQLRRALAKAKQRYQGESADAGGEGFGAASLGGQGFGGGTLASREFIVYQQALKDHIKHGWHWLAGREVYEATVTVRIVSTGVIQDARIATSSGNEKFDDSVLRAVYKASPVPPPPSHLYDRFRQVRIIFNSHE